MQTTIPVADGSIGGYFAEPQPEVAGARPWPAVVIVHDVAGLGQDVINITERFATAGYLALTPDLYSRGSKVRCIKSVFQSLLAGRGQPFGDIESARATLAARADCTGRIGVVGFCMGGAFALLAASTPEGTDGAESTEGFAASAPYYGRLPNDLSVLEGSCPIVASYGGKDPALRGAAAKLESKLTELGVPHDVKEYPEAGHSFANQMFHLGPLNRLVKVSGLHYHHESSEDAWRRVMTFFAEHLR